MYDLRIVAILTANDDGSQAIVATPSEIAKSVELANQVYGPHGIHFLFDPATDMYRFNDDLLNRDCRRHDHTLYTNAALDPASDPALDADLYNNRRNELARRFPGRITVFFTTGNRYDWVKDQSRWVYGPRTYSWSNGSDEFVTMIGWDVASYGLAHELGHYLHLAHTFNAEPESLAAAADLIRKFVDVDQGAKSGAWTLFDGDGLVDTPPDPGPAVFTDPCDVAEASATVSVTFADGSMEAFVFTPDRENIMNYWDKTCRGGTPRLTQDQIGKIVGSLGGNRSHLVVPAVLYFGTWGAGDRSQTRALAWAIDDFAGRFDHEVATGRRCAHMEAYDVGGSRIRYDGVWESGDGHHQTRALAWALDHFAERFNDELNAGRRCVHMQAYDIGGWQIRYDAIWESGGDREQTRALAWALDDFAQRFDDEVSASRRCVHMQAYAIGAGQIRYDGVWERGNGQQQTRALAWALDDFTNRFTAELGKGRRCVHMQAYDVGGGLIRYDGIWETGDDQGQSAAFAWAFNDFVQRCEQEAAAGKRLVHLQAYDIGSGQLRYDGVWQKSDDGDQQRRALALPLDTFADHFDELTSSGMHVELMSACLRTYDLLQPSHFTKGTVAGREVFFGSDFDRKPAFMAPLPIEPMTTRRPGCDLKPKGSVR